MKPLQFAARNDFANLRVVKGLEAALQRGLPALQGRATDETVAEVRGLIAGLDAAPLPDKRARISRLLALLAGVDAPASPAPPPPAAPPPAAPRARPAPSGKKVRQAAPKAEVNATGRRVKMAAVNPGTPLAEVVGVGPKTAERLAARGLKTVQDALFFLPLGYEDRTAFRPIATLAAGERVMVRGEVLAATVRPAGRGKRVFELAVGDGTGTLSCRFFRFYQGQMESRYPRGTQVVVSGAVTQWGAMRQMVHPEIEVLGVSSEVEPEGLVPRYPDIEGVPAKKLRAILTELAEAAAVQVQDHLPGPLLDALRLPALSEAVLRAHRPEPGDAAEGEALHAMRARLVFDELLLLQLALGLARQGREAEPGVVSAAPEGWRALARRVLPFEPTPAQARALDEITCDMAGPRPMNRLLQGDVGAGKTAVAFVAAAVACAAGRQAALLAPTEILAEQHFANAQRMLGPAGIRAALLTGSTKTSERRWLLSQLRAGELHLLIGTHALLEPAVVFKDLGLAIVDEQHRFGVEQRAALAAKREAEVPDVLVMTATPIPRTLALTAYGDLRVTIIDALPPGRSPTETRVFGPRRREQALEVLRAEVAAGRQGFVVFPLIEASDKLELKAATEELKSLQESLPGVQVGLLHGRMSADDKAAVMARFVRGEVHVLVSTTVIEVGVDVPNATVMMVENAERFGLSQLHQLRGRVGRGAHRGRCLLVAGGAAAEGMERLAVLEASSDGFFVAERDLELRGPGEVLGTRQSGLPELALADLVRDAPVLERARQAAEALLAQDPDLDAPAHRALASEVRRRFAERLALVRA
ncbi:MAG: ATP-dependent DNA helicase RecG [Myxococcales bacterium]|nr:ATP-dependent DNA helicase RecG [Myxococcales bacterium]